MIWEQTEIPQNIPVFNVEIPITRSFLTLQVRGDQHIGVKGIDIEDMKTVLKREQDQHRGHLFVIDTGDWIENPLKRSIGHNYDIEIPDPDDQIRVALEIQEDLDRHLYGESTYNKMKSCSKTSHKHARRAGFLGNHEYRSRKESGMWLNKVLYAGKGVLDAGIHGLIKIKLVNKKLRLQRTYTVYAAHRFTNSSETISASTILRNFQKKKADVQADVYVYGHIHRRFTMPDVRFDKDGKKHKVLYVVNPSPVGQLEYATWNMYSPVQSSHYNNVYLPIERGREPWGTI